MAMELQTLLDALDTHAEIEDPLHSFQVTINTVVVRVQAVSRAVGADVDAGLQLGRQLAQTLADAVSRPFPVAHSDVGAVSSERSDAATGWRGKVSLWFERTPTTE